MNNIEKIKDHYVDNNEFLDKMTIFLERCKEAESSGESLPKIPDDIALMMWNICNRLSFSPSFINYSYRDEMVADGVENCLRYIKNFKPDISNNPFSYFTQIAYYAFIRRIVREKKQLMVKAKYVQSVHIDADIQVQIENEINDIDPNMQSFKQYLQPLLDVDLDEYNVKRKKRLESKQVTLEEIL